VRGGAEVDPRRWGLLSVVGSIVVSLVVFVVVAVVIFLIIVVVVFSVTDSSGSCFLVPW